MEPVCLFACPPGRSACAVASSIRMLHSSGRIFCPDVFSVRSLLPFGRFFRLVAFSGVQARSILYIIRFLAHKFAGTAGSFCPDVFFSGGAGSFPVFYFPCFAFNGCPARTGVSVFLLPGPVSFAGMFFSAGAGNRRPFFRTQGNKAFFRIAMALASVSNLFS